MQFLDRDTFRCLCSQVNAKVFHALVSENKQLYTSTKRTQEGMRQVLRRRCFKIASGRRVEWFMSPSEDRDGPVTDYTISKQIISIRRFREGRQHGISEYWEGTQKFSTYVDNLKEGLEIESYLVYVPTFKFAISPFDNKSRRPQIGWIFRVYHEDKLIYQDADEDYHRCVEKYNAHLRGSD